MSTLSFTRPASFGAGRRRVHSTVGPHPSTPDRTREKRTTIPNGSRPQAAPDRDTAVASTFRELHGPRLHGFALLIALGDESAASAATSAALGDAAVRLDDLRHPERAASWLRARVVRRLPRAARSPREVGAQSVAALRTLGVGDVALAGLRALSLAERTALVAAVIERFDPIDVERIVGRPPAATRRLVTEARQRYLAAIAVRARHPAGLQVSAEPGMITERIEALAAQALGTGWRST